MIAGALMLFFAFAVLAPAPTTESRAATIAREDPRTTRSGTPPEGGGGGGGGGGGDPVAPAARRDLGAATTTTTTTTKTVAPPAAANATARASRSSSSWSRARAAKKTSRKGSGSRSNAAAKSSPTPNEPPPHYEPFDYQPREGLDDAAVNVTKTQYAAGPEDLREVRWTKKTGFVLAGGGYGNQSHHVITLAPTEKNMGWHLAHRVVKIVKYTIERHYPELIDVDDPKVKPFSVLFTVKVRRRSPDETGFRTTRPRSFARRTPILKDFARRSFVPLRT